MRQRRRAHLPTLTDHDMHLVQQGATPHTELRKRMAKSHPIHNEFAKAFDNLGATDHLTEWAGKHPTDFYKLFTRMAPTPQHHKFEGKLEIGMSLQRSALDAETPIDAEFTEVENAETDPVQ